MLDDPADSKETVLNTSNILGDKFRNGTNLNYLVVVGDGKSYDHLIKLINECGNRLNWVLPYPGDWHILKNNIPIFVKIYFDAGLKELALKFHRGATLKVLTDCAKFQITNRFFIHVWEALFRYQIQTFMQTDKSQNIPDFTEILETVLSSQNFACHFDDNTEDILDSRLWENILDRKRSFENLLRDIKDDFNNWRKENCEVSETFRFWDTFIHTDFMSYLGLYLGFRSRKLELAKCVLKKIELSVLCF